MSNRTRAHSPSFGKLRESLEQVFRLFCIRPLSWYELQVAADAANHRSQPQGIRAPIAGGPDIYVGRKNTVLTERLKESLARKANWKEMEINHLAIGMVRPK
jgi:hypothetical protein